MKFKMTRAIFIFILAVLTLGAASADNSTDIGIDVSGNESAVYEDVAIGVCPIIEFLL